MDKLVDLNLQPMVTRRAANALVTFMKIHLGCFHVLPNFYCFKNDFDLRLSHRLDTGNDIVPLRMPIYVQARVGPMRIYSSSFKTSFFYHVCNNYNALRQYDLDELSYPQLRALFRLFGANNGGLVSV